MKQITFAYNMHTAIWNKLKYPPALKKRVAGDWNCGKCNNLNFQFRTVCNRCNAHQGDSKGFNSKVFIIQNPIDQAEFLDQCTPYFDLQNLPDVTSLLQELDKKQNPQPLSPTNSAASTNCSPFQQEEKISTPPQQKNIKKVSKRPPNSREGDWMCGQCGNINFQFRQECNICKTSKSFTRVYS